MRCFLTVVAMLALATSAFAGDPIIWEVQSNSGLAAQEVGEAYLTTTPGVSVLYCPSDADAPMMRTAVSGFGSIDAFDYIDATYTTPDLATLMNYDVVITYPNYAYLDCVAMGNNLAQYVDAGGRVILMVWCTYAFGNPLCGAIMSDGYSPYYSPTGGNHYSWADDGGFTPGCCITGGLEYIGQYFRDELAEYAGTTTCAYYTDQEILAGFNAGNTVHYLNGMCADGYQYSYWDGDWYLMVWNSIMGLTLYPTATENETWGGVKALYQ